MHDAQNFTFYKFTLGKVVGECRKYKGLEYKHFIMMNIHFLFTFKTTDTFMGKQKCIMHHYQGKELYHLKTDLTLLTEGWGNEG